VERKPDENIHDLLLSDALRVESPFGKHRRLALSNGPWVAIRVAKKTAAEGWPK